MKRLSDRMLNLRTENAFVVLQAVNKLIAKGEDVLSFCIGQPDFDTPKNVRFAGMKAIAEGKTGYTPSPGIPELRRAAAEMFRATRGIPVEPDHVVIATGGKPFIGYTIFAVTDYGRGHEVIYPMPGFPIYESQIRAQGAVPVPLPLLERKNFSFDIDALAEKITENTRLLILNSPHNPTGGVLGRSELEQIAELCIANDIWVYSDEVYSNLVYDAEFQSIASIPGMYERTVVVHCVSKTYAMTGWRIGYMANPTLAPHVATQVTNTESCAPHMNQWAAVEALTGPQDDAEAMRLTFLERRDLIVSGLNEIAGFRCKMPGGAFYVWPNVTEACRMVGAEDSEELRKMLLYEAKVAVLADIHFGPRVPGEGQHIRLSYASSKETILRGLDRIDDFMKKNTR
jgi:aspartate/methionine/tyrosine aminotransferase